jgi:hypothetical protein
MAWAVMSLAYVSEEPSPNLSQDTSYPIDFTWFSSISLGLYLSQIMILSFQITK